MDPLFELVVAPALPPLKDSRFGAIGAKWSAWKGAHRPCDDCVQRIHDLGAAAAPVPSGATWRRKGPISDLFLCAVDADERRRLDRAAERRHDEPLAYKEHLEKARRSR